MSAHGTFEATTEDIGGHGCQLVSPRLVRKGEPVQLVVSHESAREPLRVAGRVAWASDRQPWRLGIAYDDSGVSQSKKWFEDLLARAPGLAAFRRIPDKIPFDAVVFLATPPKFLVDFNAEEVALLRSIGSGTSVAELHALLRDRWPQAQRALFSLFAHQHVTLSRGSSVHPDAWRRILSEAESSLAIESLRSAPLPEVAPPAAPARSMTPPPVSAGASAPWPAAAAAPAAPGAAPVDPAALAGPPPTVGGAPAAAEDDPAENWLATAAEMMPATWPAPAAPPAVAAAPAPSRGVARGIDAGIGWEKTPPPAGGGEPAASASAARGRSGEAQECYRRALVELEAGKMGAAMALLRRALVLAPGDPEIAGALGRAMRGGR